MPLLVKDKLLMQHNPMVWVSKEFFSVKMDNWFPFEAFCNDTSKSECQKIRQEPESSFAVAERS